MFFDCDHLHCHGAVKVKLNLSVTLISLISHLSLLKVDFGL
jgi:hypothetical protein